MSRLLAPLLLALVVVPLASATRSVDPKPLRVRASVPADDSPKTSATQWWRVLAFEGKLHGLDGFGVGQEVGVNRAAHGGTGWFAHAMPPVPTS